MASRQPLVDSHYFGGLNTWSKGTVTGPPAEMLSSGGPSPAIYRMANLNRPDWDALREQLVDDRRLSLTAPVPDANVDDVVLLFDAPTATVPLPLAGQLTRRHQRGFFVEVDPPPLTWRLAAVDFADGLPTRSSWPSTPIIEEAMPDDSIRHRRLRLRPDLPCPAETIAPPPELSALVTKLRARFGRLDELLAELEVSSRKAIPFVAILYAVDIIVDAPTPLESWRSPYDFLGLHWSAHAPLIRRRYRTLESRLADAPDIAGISPDRFLERAFDLLSCPSLRRQIRSQLLAPSARVEVTNYFRHQLDVAQHAESPDRIDDLARRILELDPSARRPRRILSELTSTPDHALDIANADIDPR